MKRAFDVVAATVALAVTLPVMLVVAALVRITMGPPVLFQQERAGRGGAPFTIPKFRTMIDRTAPDGTPLPDEQRLTGLGRFLRSSSLDELPQLWSVLRGDMSLVGPRPLPVRYVERYTPRQRRRLEVTPGLTGWAQVNGRNALSWPEKLELDAWYVDHASFLLDLRILVATLGSLLRRSGISADGHATAPEFLGES